MYKYKKHIIIFVGLLLLIILPLVIVNSEPKTQKRQTEKSFTFVELISELEYEGNDLKPYIEKAVEIQGVIQGITYKYGRHTIILKDSLQDTMILCELQKDQNSKIKQLEIGQNIKIKGVLKGVLMDIILLNCIVLE